MSVGIVKSQDAKFQAMIIYNFTRTLQWPAESQKGDFVINVLGESEIFKEMKSFSSDQTVRGEQKIVVQKVTLETVGKCQILIVTKSKSAELVSAIGKLQGKGTLIISEQNDKMSEGAGISFTKDENGIVKYQYSEKNIKSQAIDISTSFREVGAGGN